MVAISTLILLLETTNYSYVQECTTAKDAWKALETAFEDSGICRRVDLLRSLVQLKLNECESMEDYINKMTSTSIKVKKAGLKIDDEVIASLMLAGLPDEYRPMVMAVENSTTNLTTDSVKTRLLQEVKFEKSNDGEAVALISKKHQKPKNKKKVTCFVCDEPGHYTTHSCPKKNKKSDKLLLMTSSFVAKSDNTHQWYIDSGASAHMTMNDGNLSDVREPMNKEIIVGDNSRLNVKCAGDIRMAIAANSDSKSDHVTVKNVL